MLWILAGLALAQPASGSAPTEAAVDTSRSIQAFGKDWTVFSAPRVLTITDRTQGYPVFRELPPAEMDARGSRAVYRTRMHDGTAVILTVERKPCRDEQGEALELHARIEAGSLRKSGCARYDEYPDVESVPGELVLGDLDLEHGITAGGAGWTARLGGSQENLVRLDGRDFPVEESEDFERPRPTIAGDRAVYRVRLTDGRPALATVTARPCRRKRQAVPLTVELTVGDRRLAGCATQSQPELVAPPPILQAPITDVP